MINIPQSIPAINALEEVRKKIVSQCAISPVLLDDKTRATATSQKHKGTV